MWRLGRTALRDVATGAACVGVIVLAFMGLPPIILLLFAGMDIMLVASRQRLSASHHLLAWFIPVSATTPAQAAAATAATPAVTVGLASLFGVFLKIGAVLYGSGYVLLAFLHSDLVERWHWLSAQQLLDAVAIGQVTPGPVLTTATFLGYLLAGHLGALVATLGIFLPSFCFVALVNPLIPRLRNSKWTSGFLDGVIAGSLGLMAVVTWKLASTTLTDWFTGTLALLSAVALGYFRVNTTWLVGGGALVGFSVHLVGL
jgi:chromate transporter